MTQTQTVHGEHKTKVKAEETKLIDYRGLNIDRRKHFDTVINWLMRSDASGVGGRIACGPWQTSVSRAVSHRGSASHTQTHTDNCIPFVTLVRSSPSLQITSRSFR